MTSINPDDYLARRLLQATRVTPGGVHYLEVGGHRVPVTLNEWTGGNRVCQEIAKASGRKYGPNTDFRLITAAGAWGRAELTLFPDQLVEVWEFQERDYLLDKAAAAMCEADGLAWADAQLEDRNRWRKIASQVDLAKPDRTDWPSERHPVTEAAKV